MASSSLASPTDVSVYPLSETHKQKRVMDVVCLGWSAPSAIATGGVGFGFQAGADFTDVVLILNSDEAVDAFKTKGNLTLGGDLGVSHLGEGDFIVILISKLGIPGPTGRRRKL
jgi:hypothetical protein